MTAGGGLDKNRDPEMHQTKKGSQYFFGVKSHIGVDVDVDAGLGHSVVGTPANVADVTQVDQLLHGEEVHVCGDAGYTRVQKRPKYQDRKMIWSISTRPSSYKEHGKDTVIGSVLRGVEYAKALRNELARCLENPGRFTRYEWLTQEIQFPQIGILGPISPSLLA